MGAQCLRGLCRVGLAGCSYRIAKKRGCYGLSIRNLFVPEAGKAEDLRKIRESAAERNATLLFGAKDAERNNARVLVAFVRELGGATYAVRKLTTPSRTVK